MNVMMNVIVAPSANETAGVSDGLQAKETGDVFASELDKAQSTVPQQKNDQPGKTQNPAADAKDQETAAAESTDPAEVCIKVLIGKANQGEAVEMVNPDGKGVPEKATEENAGEDAQVTMQEQAAATGIPAFIPVMPVVQEQANAASTNENTQAMPAVPQMMTAQPTAAANAAGQAAWPQQQALAEEIPAGMAAENANGDDAAAKTQPEQVLPTADMQPKEAENFAAAAMKEVGDSLKTAKNETQPQTETVQSAGAENKTAPAQGKPAASADGESGQNESKQQPETSGLKQSQPVLTAFVNPEGKVDMASSVTQMQEQPAVKQPVISQIVDQVTTAVSNEKSEISVQLKPEHLGGLTISLVMEESGLTAKLVTTEQHVQHMIRAEMASLQETLRDKGINVVHMEVICDQSMNMGNNNQAKGDGRWASGYYAGNGDSVEGADETASFLYNLSSYDVLAEQGGSVEFSA